MHIPLLIKDETLYGVLARGMHINGYRHHLAGIEELTGYKVTSLASLSAEALLNLDYVIGLGSADHLGVSLLEQHLGASEHTAHDLISYASGLRINGAWKTCSKCVEDDTEQYGTGSWHLPHQLPTTLMCPVHGEPLKAHAIKRKMLHERFYLPIEVASVDLEIEISVRPHLENLAQLAFDAIRDKSEPYTPIVVRQTFKRAMIEKGFLKSGGLSKNACKEFSVFFSPLDVSKTLGINPARLFDGILGDDESPVIYRLILVYWLFGSWQYFKSSCCWQSVFSEPECISVDIGLTYSEVRQQYRTRCLIYITSIAEMDRATLLRVDYKVFRWLKNNDRQWLDNQLPNKHQVQYRLF